MSACAHSASVGDVLSPPTTANVPALCMDDSCVVNLLLAVGFASCFLAYVGGVHMLAV
jgi:hypothetical protein